MRELGEGVGWLTGREGLAVRCGKRVGAVVAGPPRRSPFNDAVKSTQQLCFRNPTWNCLKIKLEWSGSQDDSRRAHSEPKVYKD